jgi:hypothetical protein
MATLIGVKGSDGYNGTPAVWQVARVRVGEQNGGWPKVESGAHEDGCKIPSKLCAIPVEEGGNVVKVVGEELWRPCCEAACGFVNSYTHIYEQPALTIGKSRQANKGGGFKNPIEDFGILLITDQVARYW